MKSSKQMKKDFILWVLNTITLVITCVFILDLLFSSRTFNSVSTDLIFATIWFVAGRKLFKRQLWKNDIDTIYSLSKSYVESKLGQEITIENKFRIALSYIFPKLDVWGRVITNNGDMYLFGIKNNKATIVRQQIIDREVAPKNTAVNSNEKKNSNVASNETVDNSSSNSQSTSNSTEVNNNAVSEEVKELADIWLKENEQILNDIIPQQLACNCDVIYFKGLYIFDENNEKLAELTMPINGEIFPLLRNKFSEDEFYLSKLAKGEYAFSWEEDNENII